MTAADRLPNDVKSEELVLGAVLQFPKLLTALRQTLRPEHFWILPHRAIYETFLVMQDAGKPIEDLRLLETELRKLPAYDEQFTDLYTWMTGGMRFPRWIEDCGAPQNAPQYAQNIIEAASRRKLLEVVQEVQQIAASGDIGQITESRFDLQGVARGSLHWEPPLSFDEFCAPPFPIHALPNWQSDFVAALSAATQTPPDLAAMQVLAVNALAAAKTFRVHVAGEWYEPTNLYLLTVLPSGERKSPVFRAALQPVRDYEREKNEALAPMIAAANSELRMLQSRLKQVEEQVGKTKPQGERQQLEDQAQSLAKQVEAFRVPVQMRLIADDITSEKLAALLEEQGERLAILAAEGGIFETAAGRYAQGVPNIDVFLKAFSGDPVDIDRVSRPPVRLNAPALTLGLAVQPDVLRGLREKPGFRGRGLLGRFLYSLPVSNVGYRTTDTPKIPSEVVAAYQNGIEQMLRLEPPQDERGRPRPYVLHLTPEALELFNDYRDCAERNLREGGTLAEMSDWGNKFPGNVARLAAMLHIAEHGTTSLTIEYGAMRAAIQMGNYFAEHAKAAYDQMGMNEDMDNARYLLSWIQRKGVDRFQKWNAHRDLQARFKKAEQIDRPLAILCERYFIREEPPAEKLGAGRKPSPFYEVSPYMKELNKLKE